MSCHPDPFGVLNEGEIFFRSSVPLTDPDTNHYFDILSGDVIVRLTLASNVSLSARSSYQVGRTPMCVPSDMRKASLLPLFQVTLVNVDAFKVKAVNCPQLANYYDVAVFPVKGDRSLQSWLSGGGRNTSSFCIHCLMQP
jgi:RNA-dependent RNA polymerase